MAHVIWKHPKPTPSPFGAVVGDLTKYAVHFCEARDHKNEEAGILDTVIEPVLAAAKEVKRAEARVVLFDFDVVYSILTIVVTDKDRSQDEREIFKLAFRDWDQEMQEGNPTDSEFENRCEKLKQRVFAMLAAALRQEKYFEIVEYLKAQGFELWFSDGNTESEWKQLEI